MLAISSDRLRNIRCRYRAFSNAEAPLSGQLTRMMNFEILSGNTLTTGPLLPACWHPNLALLRVLRDGPRGNVSRDGFLSKDFQPICPRLNISKPIQDVSPRPRTSLHSKTS